VAKHRYALVACARWEEDAIEEWLDYHRSIGFDHVYLYSNDDDPTALLAAVSRHVRGRTPFVTFRHWPRVGDQVPIYLDFLDEFKQETDWYSFLDVDEFFVLKNKNNVHAFMQEYEDDVDCLYFNWVLYGHDGNVQRPSGSTLLTHRRRAAGPDVHTKMLCRSAAISAMEVRRKAKSGHGAFWHFFDNYALEGVRCRDVLHHPTDGYSARFPQTAEPFVARPNYADDVLNRGYVAHYQFKSEDDFLRRWRRGGFVAIGERWRSLYETGQYKKILDERNAVSDDYLAEYWISHTAKTASAVDDQPDEAAVSDEPTGPVPDARLGAVAVCAIFKDEAPHLLEWIAYHLAIGFDHVVLFDNGSTDGGPALVSDSIFGPFVTIIHWPERPGQLAAFRHFIGHHAKFFEWAAFIDVDEFVHPLSRDSIRDLLPLYSGMSAVVLQWQEFGASGHITRPAGLTIESYNTKLPAEHPRANQAKSIVRTADLLGVLTGSHVLNVSGNSCNARGEVLERRNSNPQCHDVMVINHYYSRSREDWEAKRRRGFQSARVPGDHYGLHEFEAHDRAATIRDDRIKRFVPLVKETLANGPARSMITVRFDQASQAEAHWLRPRASPPEQAAAETGDPPPQAGAIVIPPVTHIDPAGGLADQMMQYMLALKFASLVPGCRISNVRLPAWGIDLPAIEVQGASLAWTSPRSLDMASLAQRMKAGELHRLQYGGRHQRMEYLLDRNSYRDVFRTTDHRDVGYGADHLVCHLGAADASRTPHDGYVLAPVAFYRDIVAQTRLRPVFIGDTGPSHYLDRLLEALPQAIVRPPGDMILDFEIVRQSRNVVVGCSMLCWLAAWLSDAEQIIFPVNGALNPRQDGRVNLLPLGDPRYRFHLFPINHAEPDPAVAARHQAIEGLWREVPHDYLRRLLAEAPRVPRRIEPFLELFDEDYYIMRFPSVRKALADGWLASGLAHFTKWGFEDGLGWWCFDLDEHWYTTQYPMAALEIAQGDYADCRHHYAEIGRKRGYRPVGVIDTGESR
jgi:hypothetical protein